MFIGHFAMGLAAKKINPSPSLGTYFLAAQFLDLLWPTLLLLGVEKAEINHSADSPVPLSFTHYPISHSLLTVAGWGLLFGMVYWLLTKNKVESVIVGICVVSHWVLDLLVHIPDLPLYPGSSSYYGLGLWEMKIAALGLELLLFAVGVAMYYSATEVKNKTGKYATAALIIFLLVIHFMNVFGPPPPDIKAVAWAGQLQWLFVLWAFWIDRNRVAKGGWPVHQKAELSAATV